MAAGSPPSWRSSDETAIASSLGLEADSRRTTCSASSSAIADDGTGAQTGYGFVAGRQLSDLDLAALLCSRVCHDVISPVGAIANGLELMDDPETDAEMKATALDMVRSSAKTATAKLKFCRIAFGASGSAGAHIDMGEAGETAKAAEYKLVVGCAHGLLHQFNS